MNTGFYDEVASHIETSQLIFFLLPFGCPTANFGPLSTGQPHSPDANHCVLHIRPEGHREPRSEARSDLQSKSIDWFLYDDWEIHNNINLHIESEYKKIQNGKKLYFILFSFFYVLCFMFYVDIIHVKDVIFIAQKMKFSIKDFFSKCDQILNGKLHFLCSASGSLHNLLACSYIPSSWSI